jgi:hypothetical protein
MSVMGPGGRRLTEFSREFIEVDWTFLCAWVDYALQQEIPPIFPSQKQTDLFTREERHPFHHRCRSKWEKNFFSE